MSSPQIPNTDHWTNEAIIAIVDEIHASGTCVEQREDACKEKYATFIERYPILFMMACENTYDKTTLMYMMSMRNQVLNNERSVESASRIVGDKFFRKFVAPVVNDLDNSKNKKPKN
jgi:hypothetical protein